MENENFTPSSEAEISDSSATPQAEEKDTFTVRFNHKDTVLSRDEAINYAQKGMKLLAVTPLLNELKLLAHLKNKSPEDTVKELISLEEDNFKQRLEKDLGNDENAKLALFERFKRDMSSKREELGTDKAQAEIKKAFSEKIADEFTELMGECPEIDSLEKIPLEVLKNAREENLLNAYLRHKNREDRKILKERESQQKNKAASAGELTAGGEQHDTLLSAFIKGLRY